MILIIKIDKYDINLLDSLINKFYFDYMLGTNWILLNKWWFWLQL